MVQIEQLLQNFAPAEVLVAKPSKKTFADQMGEQFNVFYLEDWIFESSYAMEQLTTHFKTFGLKGFGIEDIETGVISAGAILHYLKEAHHNQIPHITSIRRIFEEEYVWMDRFTVRNLELYGSVSINAITLLDVIDKTISPMGGRLLKRWLALPLKNIEAIQERHQVVSYLLEQVTVFDKTRDHIKKIGDLERLISKVANNESTLESIQTTCIGNIY